VGALPQAAWRLDATPELWPGETRVRVDRLTLDAASFCQLTAALGAEGVAADVTMLIGNGYVPGHADLALDLIRAEPGVRQIFASRTTEG